MALLAFFFVQFLLKINRVLVNYQLFIDFTCNMVFQVIQLATEVLKTTKTTYKCAL